MKATVEINKTSVASYTKEGGTTFVALGESNSFDLIQKSGIAIDYATEGVHETIDEVAFLVPFASSPRDCEVLLNSTRPGKAQIIRGTDAVAYRYFTEKRKHTPRRFTAVFVTEEEIDVGYYSYTKALGLNVIQRIDQKSRRLLGYEAYEARPDIRHNHNIACVDTFFAKKVHGCIDHVIISGTGMDIREIAEWIFPQIDENSDWTVGAPDYAMKGAVDFNTEAHVFGSGLPFDIKAYSPCGSFTVFRAGTPLGSSVEKDVEIWQSGCSKTGIMLFYDNRRKRNSKPVDEYYKGDPILYMEFPKGVDFIARYALHVELMEDGTASGYLEDELDRRHLLTSRGAEEAFVLFENGEIGYPTVVCEK